MPNKTIETMLVPITLNYYERGWILSTEEPGTWVLNLYLRPFGQADEAACRQLSATVSETNWHICDAASNVCAFGVASSVEQGKISARSALLDMLMQLRQQID